MTVHTYTARTVWHGSTAGHYAQYDRTHRVTAAPAEASLDLSADPHFRGDERMLNPEQLVVAAASSCQLLSFLGAANRAGLDIRGYVDHAHGVMDTASDPARIAEIALHPVVTVAPGTDHAAVVVAAERAHETCYVANSLSSEVTVDVTVRDAAPARAAWS